MKTPDNQPNLWQQRTNHQVLSELANALYERELKRLSQDEGLDLQTIQKRLRSLPYYIKRASEHIAELYTPLDLDSQNGSWLGTQSAKPFSIKAAPEKTEMYYQQHAKMALIVPVAVSHYGIEQVKLDTIDEIDWDQKRLHCNEQGWFQFNGQQLEPNRLYNKTLLKLGKPIMSAACCGHQWLNLHKTTPRLLSLREMLLASRINWQQFHKLLSLNM
ncbi:hypothetical protein KO525_11415 [Psychrosphaera sp. B3R10]|uniref:Uncharacterized protein n=1 Tax=Psychrosphaera algicola TaxID=3023714 RepID=A0ABT5FBY8_9GAMM|nr:MULTISPECIES: hypothetical protein [unclassified Psychrosphaera]MBU2881065.1 hypothetical protein [Psychrosphaera sp. I2R16]MBU2989989.1 hypothetical protein [Psychrosphaera sp. B3R10]MDC2889058.1 hypothetical protein [Psychrosphaera sp. G1-22]MDO6719119.1 hypothetical protein [Psychrosphaera sp. 1_MG-2023]